MDIPNSISTLGSFACMLSFMSIEESFEDMYEKISLDFTPDEVSFSAFNVQSSEIDFSFDIDKPIHNKNLIKQVIMHRNEDRIILESYQGRHSIQLLPKLENTYFNSGLSLLRKYASKYNNIDIICGFEIELELDNYEQSFKILIQDESLYPFAVCRKDDNDFFCTTLYDLYDNREETQLENYALNKIEVYTKALLTGLPHYPSFKRGGTSSPSLFVD